MLSGRNGRKSWGKSGDIPFQNATTWFHQLAEFPFEYDDFSASFR
jgi:hypothetical protein